MGQRVDGDPQQQQQQQQLPAWQALLGRSHAAPGEGDQDALGASRPLRPGQRGTLTCVLDLPPGTVCLCVCVCLSVSLAMCNTQGGLSVCACVALFATRVLPAVKGSLGKRVTCACLMWGWGGGKVRGATSSIGREGRRVHCSWPERQIGAVKFRLGVPHHAVEEQELIMCISITSVSSRTAGRPLPSTMQIGSS